MYITHYSDAQRVIATTAAGALQRSEMYQHCGLLGARIASWFIHLYTNREL